MVTTSTLSAFFNLPFAIFEEELAQYLAVPDTRQVLDSIDRGGDTDNLVLEINGSKHAWNITLSEVRADIVLINILSNY